MPVKFSNSQEFLNKLQMNINLFMGLPMILFIYLFLRIENMTYNPEFLSDYILQYMRVGFFIIVVVSVGIGFFSFTRHVSYLNPAMSLKDKLELYFSAAMTRTYFFVTATLVTLLGMALSGESLYSIYYTISLVAFSISYPTLYRINRQLRLNSEEREIVLKRSEIK